MHITNCGRTDLPACGVYRHFKGNLYVVLGSVIDATTDREMVLYKSAEGNELYVRTAANFNEEVTPDLRSRARPRFARLQLGDLKEGME